MKVDKIVESYSMALAYGMLLCEIEDLPFKEYVDITRQIKSGIPESNFKGLGLLFCYKVCELGTNENKIQFKLQDNIQPGTKIWENKYRLVADFPKSGKTVIINDVIFYDFKKDAENKGKEWCVENARDVHIVTTKVIKDADPCTTSIIYKPSIKQSLSTFKFIS